MTSIAEISTDPLYLTALASLGQSGLQPSKVAPEGSIAVLPFTNMSDDAQQEHFVDGLAEDIITDLSNIAGMFVISRNSSFAYKGKVSDVRQIAADLGVRYVLEGSARKSGDRLRITAQLIDAGNGGKHIWAERFDQNVADIFAIQDAVTAKVVEAVRGALDHKHQESRYRPSNLEAYELCVRSRGLWIIGKDEAREAEIMLEKAILLDPNYAEAYWRLAQVKAFNWLHYGGDSKLNRAAALALSGRAIALDPFDSGGFSIYGHVVAYEGSLDKGLEHVETAIRLNPNDAGSLLFYSDLLFLSGNAPQALENTVKAIRLNPRAPGSYYWGLGQAQAACGQYAEAIVTLSRSETYRSQSRKILAVAYHLCGRENEAKIEAEMCMAVWPDWSCEEWAATRPFRKQEDREFWLKGFKAVGFK